MRRPGRTLLDPYTGSRVAFAKVHADDVQIDHVVPLAYAWDMGASGWPLATRETFANDEARNLLAVSKAANLAKSDKGLAAWLPGNAAYHCAYAVRWVTVATAYGLALGVGDAVTLRDILVTCAR